MSDLISRQEAKKKHCDICRDTKVCFRDFSTCPEVKAFDLIPSTERSKGKWIECGEPDENGKFEFWYCVCSLCGAVGLLDYRACPNCGAEMEVKE